MNEEHEDGRCYACGKDKPVRWKNLYTIGSEGTWLCMECEMMVVHFVRDLARKAMRKKIEKIKKMKKNA
jgi:hypothetical protein